MINKVSLDVQLLTRHVSANAFQEDRRWLSEEQQFGTPDGTRSAQLQDPLRTGLPRVPPRFPGGTPRLNRITAGADKDHLKEKEKENGMRLCMRIWFLLCGIARSGRRIVVLTSCRTEASLEQRGMVNREGFRGRGRGRLSESRGGLGRQEKEVEFLVDTGASFSVLNQELIPVSKDLVTVVGATGQQEKVFFLKPLNLKDLHPVVANPYTLLTKLQVWFTVLDLKDAFFCLPLAKESQNLLAFEWESPTTGRKTQLTWTVLPQGFKNSPTIFGNQLA
ncbi:hypothetical protein QYF61_015798 [Mycteria americana]|uniref:ribonuclease H n=1 Tax=Mycteria americana TaxID=33587 RepID=A0AAN7NSN8_MYCAM|nr:hypothetical protein QYF61_015798 [Mycteria americana]